MSKLPDGFCYLVEMDSSIIQDIRYATKENFVGEIIDGYSPFENDAIMSIAACKALCKAQHLLILQGYSLVLYDSYRPQRAVDHFMRWSSAPTISSESAMQKNWYYPKLNREDLFDLGYIAGRSGHSRGSTVDVTLIEVGKRLSSPALTYRGLPPGKDRFEEVRNLECCDWPCYPFIDDGTVDMGTSFDLFDRISHHDCPDDILPAHYAQPRNLLREAMESCGFRCYDQEWWHYTLIDEPFPDTYFDF